LFQELLQGLLAKKIFQNLERTHRMKVPIAKHLRHTTAKIGHELFHVARFQQSGL
jgi:hypothetical protein